MRQTDRGTVITRADIIIVIQQAAVLYAALMGLIGLLWPYDPHDICPDLLFNVDQYSLQLQDGCETGHCRAAGGTKNTSKSSYISAGGKTFGLSVVKVNVVCRGWRTPRAGWELGKR